MGLKPRPLGRNSSVLVKQFMIKYSHENVQVQAIQIEKE